MAKILPEQKVSKKGLLELLRNYIFLSFFLAFIICVSYFFWIAKLPFTERFRLKTLDLLYVVDFKISQPEEAARDIVMITIDDDSIKNIDAKWPWTRGIIAGIIKNISEYNPELICIDMAFVGEYIDPIQDLTLAKAIRDAGNVFLISFFGSEGQYIKPLEILANNAKGYGFVNKPRDPDNTIRRFRPWIRDKGGKLIDYSLGAKLAAVSLNTTPQELLSSLPYLPNYTIYGNFFINAEAVNSISAWKIFERKIDLNYFVGKKVFLGVTAEVIHDIYNTPIGRLSGVEILINETLSYITKKYFSYPNNYFNLIIIYGLLFIFFLINFKLSTLYGLIAYILEMFLVAGASLWLFRYRIMVDYGGISLVLFSSASVFYLYEYSYIFTENLILRKQAFRDGLTNLYVYRYLEARLRKDFNLARKTNKPISLIMMDIDYFKAINDEFGHEGGNMVIKFVADVISNGTRTTDIASRYGGDEFCILLTETPSSGAMAYVERLVGQVERGCGNLDILARKAKKVTLSIGIASFEGKDFNNYKDLIEAADAALYHSKKTGRNKISLFGKELTFL